MAEDKNTLNQNTPPKPVKGTVTLNYFWLLLLVLITIILTALITTLSLETGSEKAVNVGTDTRSEFGKLYSVYDTINSNYYDEVDREELIESAIDGMVKGLDDPYSEYLTTDENELFQQSITGDFQGIGAEVMQQDNYIVITSPLKESPAEKVGLEPGDKVIAVDGISIEGYNTLEAVELIRGEKGSDVELTIVRGDDAPFDVTITRDEIHIDSITYENIEGIGHISINRFQQGTSDEFYDAINEAKENNNESLILDFRFNPGGLLDEAVKMINAFVDRGEKAIILEDGNGNESAVTTSNQPIVTPSDFEKIYILLNEGSASASEVFAGALRDQLNIPIAGTTSFGKGVVQRTKDYEDNSLLKYTHDKWLTPNGNWVQDDGITPDVELVNPDYYRVTMLNAEDVYTENQENKDILSIKVALNTLGYEIEQFNETFDDELTRAVKAFQADNNLDQTGDVTGDTTTTLMNELREYVNNNDAQLKYLVDFMNDEYTEEEIEALAKENAQHIEIVDVNEHTNDIEAEE